MIIRNKKTLVAVALAAIMATGATVVGGAAGASPAAAGSKVSNSPTNAAVKKATNTTANKIVANWAAQRSIGAAIRSISESLTPLARK